MSESVACYGTTIRARRITELVHRELALGPASLTNHRETFQLSRIWIYGQYPLGGLLGGDGCRLLLLLVEFAHVG